MEDTYEFRRIIEELLKNEKVQEMKKYRQHFNRSCFEVMLLEIAFQSDQIGQLPQSLKQRGGVLSVFDSVRVGNGNHLVVHIQKSSLVLYGFF